MIHEYALELELVATWTDRRTCHSIKENFGLGQGRLVSQYPKRWKRLVWDSFDCTDDFARLRLTELLARLSERMVRRSNIQWDANSTSWLENAEREHDRCPFHAIIVQTNPERHTHVLTESEMGDDSATRWPVRRGLSVKRSAVEMAEAVSPMLKCSSVVIFIDPYFGPERPRYRYPFEAFLERMLRQRPGEEPERIEVHTSAENTGEEKFFREACTKNLCRWIPDEIPVLVRRLKKKQGGERLHNRYILTDLGGVAFGTGLDEGKEGETDDITLMARDQYQLRWSQYGGNPPAGFDQKATPVEVVGTRKLPKLS